MAKIELSSKLYVELIEDWTKKQIARPTAIKSGRATDYKWEEEMSVKYSLRGIYTIDGHMVVHARYTVDLIELINGYVSKILEKDSEYPYVFRGGEFGFKVAIAPETKQQSEALKLTILSTGEVIYLKKIDCKMIVSKFHRAYSKCVDLGFEIDSVTNR